MLKITVCGVKGGIMKTTLAIHLTAYFQQLNKQALLIDADPRNRSAVQWAQSQQALPFPVVDDRLALQFFERNKLDVVVFDTAGSADPNDIEVLSKGCDLLVLPSSPDAPSMASLIKTLKLLQSFPKAVYKVVLTRTPPPRLTGEIAPEEADARSVLASLKVPVFKQSIPELKAFRHAASGGTLVSALNVSGAARAWECCVALGREVQREVTA